MIDFKKHLVLALLMLGCAGGFKGWARAQEAFRAGEPVLPTMAFSANPVSSEPASGLESRQRDEKTRTIDVIGRGTIYHDDVARARGNAIADALQGVVEKAIGLLVSPASVVQDFQLLSDRVFDQTEAFIHDYKVLTESKSGRNYRVVVRATVSMEAIRDKLESVGILMTPTGMPTIVFFVSEQNIGKTSPQYWWGQRPFSGDLSVTENVLSEYMREREFIVVDRAALGRDVQVGPQYMDPELSDDAAAKLGKEFRADLAIIGNTIARYSGSLSDTNMKSIQATVSTRAVRTDTGTVIASSQETRGVVRQDDRAGGMEAIILSATAVAQDLTMQIGAKWHKELQQPVLIELVVKGITEYADFVRFRRHLTNDIRGVRNVYLRSIAAGEAKMDVDMIGNPRVLADDLMLQPFENLAVNILEVSEKGVKLELMPSPIGESQTEKGEW